MKTFLIGIVVIIVLGIIGFFGLRYLSGKQPVSSVPSAKVSVTVSGTIQPLEGDDYHYAVLSGGKLIGVNSQTIKLAGFVGKKVSITGQYSGTTLYADTVTVTQ